MKINKFLTFLTPIAIVGTIAPTIVSCGCSKKTYVYNYKDHINCLGKQYGDYKKLGTIQKAAKIRTERQQRGLVNLDDINSKFNGIDGGQFAFNELIASATIMTKEKINLNDWSWTNNNENSFVFGNSKTPFTNIKFKYENDESENKIYLICTGNELELKYKSYVYQDCLIG